MYKHELEQKCPYCDREVDGKGIPWGENLWHPECYEAYGRDWDDWDRHRLGLQDSGTDEGQTAQQAGARLSPAPTLQ